MTRNIATLILLFLCCVSPFGCATATIEQRQNILNNSNLRAQKTHIKDSEQLRKPLKAGQWVTVLMESQKGDKDLILRTFKVLEANPSQTKIEIVTRSALHEGAEEVEAYEIEGFPSTPPFQFKKYDLKKIINNINFKRVIEKKADKQKEWSSELLYFSKPWLTKLFLVGYAVQETTSVENCANGYLESNRCYVYPFILEFLDYHAEGKVWAHSEIPVIGLIQAEDTYAKTKTIAYGDDGMQPQIHFKTPSP